MGEPFEPPAEEPDDFLLPEVLADGSECKLPPNCTQLVPKKKIKYKPEPKTVSPKKRARDDATVATSPPKKRGRPRKIELEYAASARSSSVAAMVPSAVKKRAWSSE